MTRRGRTRSKRFGRSSALRFEQMALERHAADSPTVIRLSDILITSSGRDMELENLKAQVALLAAKLDNQPGPSRAVATVLSVLPSL